METLRGHDRTALTEHPELIEWLRAMISANPPVDLHAPGYVRTEHWFEEIKSHVLVQVWSYDLVPDPYPSREEFDQQMWPHNHLLIKWVSDYRGMRQWAPGTFPHKERRFQAVIPGLAVVKVTISDWP